MASTSIDLGTGATVVFTTTTHAMSWTSMSLGEHSIEMVDTSHLGSSGFRSAIGGDLKAPGETTFEFLFDTENAPAVTNVAETVTITFPQSAENTTSAATYAGTGVVRSVTFPTLGVDELQTGTLVVAWDGGTGPTFTDAV